MASIVSDEQIISALVSNGTIRAAADMLGVSERSLYDRMGNREFKEKYRAAKADIVRKAVFDLNMQIGSAVATIVEIMNDKSCSPAIRLRSAQIILDNASQFASRLNEDERSYFEQQCSKTSRMRF